MPSIDGFELPHEITSELQHLVDQSSDNAIRALVHGVPELKKGFRNKKTKGGAPIFRQRLRGYIVTSGELHNGLLGFLSGQSKASSFIRENSFKTLSPFLEHFLDIFGSVQLLTGMLIDARKEVRQAAISALQNGRHRKNDDPDAARAELYNELAPFLRHIGEPGRSDTKGEARELSLPEPPPEVTAEKQNQEPVRELAGGLRAAEKEQRKLQHHVEPLKKRLQESEEHCRKLKQRIEQEKIRCEELAQEKKQAREELNSALARFEEEVDARVRTALAARFRTWLTTAEQIETQTGKSGVDLLERATAALARQADIDRKSGNLRLLRERLSQVETMLGRVRQAEAEALSPLPELRRLERELTTEQERLVKILGINNGSSSVLRVLLARIGASRQPEELLRIQQMLKELEVQEVLASSEIVQLHAACNSALGKLYDKDLATGRPRRGAADSLLKLQESIAKGTSFALLVDGHNVLFGLPHIYGPLYDANGQPGPRAREALLSAIATLTGEKGRGRAWVFFDGETPDERPYSFTVQEVYSGGGKATIRDRADQSIIDYLDRVVRKEGLTVLVTDDVELGRAARGRGAAVASLTAFASLVIGLSADRRRGRPLS